MIKRKPILVTLIGLALPVVVACSTLSPIATQIFSPATMTPGVTIMSSTTTASGVATMPGMSPTTSGNVSIIQNVIQKTNQEQVQALATRDPTIMQDTSTAGFYQQSVQTLNDLLSSGVTAIQLVDLKWGTVTLTDASSAQATTYETWSTTFSDGSTMKETDTNIYTLVLESGTWKVQEDQHPGANNQGSPQANAGGATSPATPAPPADTATGQSRSANWSGYAATGGTFTSVSGTWTVPNVSADLIGMDATWIGIGGVDANDLIQAGTEAIVESGRVMYSALWEKLPDVAQPVPLAINAGDQISVSITQQSTDTWQININNTTNGQSWSKNVTYRSSLSSAEWIEEAPATERSTILPLDSFGSVTFTSATAVENGQTVSIAQAGATPITMHNEAGQALAQASNLDASGTSFTVTRTSAAPSLLPSHHRRPGG
jgi:hypothetical protein